MIVHELRFFGNSSRGEAHTISEPSLATNRLRSIAVTSDQLG